jgi:predicted helicase
MDGATQNGLNTGGNNLAKIFYHAVPGDWRKEQKYQFLEKTGSVAGVQWQTLAPDDKGNWITNDSDEEFDSFLPIGSKDAKAGTTSVPTIFRTYSLGVSTNRDAVVYDFDAKRLAKRVEQFADDYNAELNRWQKKGRPADVDNFVSYEKIKWSRNLKRWFRQEEEMKIVRTAARICLYRPFNSQWLHFQRMVVDEVGTSGTFFPNQKTEKENWAICTPGAGAFRPFHTLAIRGLVSMDFIDKTQCFPLFTYSEDGKHKQDNVTAKARTLFQIFYEDDTITQADIFHYVYAVLHHPVYRTRFAENLKRDLPRIPFVGVAADVSPLKSPPAKPKNKLEPTHVGCYENKFYPLAAVEKMQGDAKPDHDPKASAKLFHAFAAAGQQLADLHVNYESAREFKLQRVENKEVKLDWRVEAMKLTKDKSAIVYNDFLTLAGIPPEVFDYKLGNRSALEWVIDQYRVTRDEKGDIASDPNRMDDEQYIVRLIAQVVTVSLETLEVIASLPPITTTG